MIEIAPVQYYTFVEKVGAITNRYFHQSQDQEKNFLVSFSTSP